MTTFAPTPRSGRGPTGTKPTKKDSTKKYKSATEVVLQDLVLSCTSIQAPRVVIHNCVLSKNLAIRGASKVDIDGIWQTGQFGASAGLGIADSEGTVNHAYLVGNDNDQVTVGGGAGRVEFLNSTIYPGPNMYQAPGNPHPAHKDACDIGALDLLVFTNCDVTGTMNSAIWGKATFQHGADQAMRAFQATGSRFSCRRVGDNEHRNPHTIYLGSQCKTAKVWDCDFDALPMSSLRAVVDVTKFDIRNSTYYNSADDRSAGDAVEINWVDVPY